MNTKIDFAAIAAAALSSAESLLQWWLPDGKRDGHEFKARNPTRSDKKAGSFSINLNTGAWGDFATGDQGGDLVSLYAYLNDLSQKDAALELGRELRVLPESGGVPVAPAPLPEKNDDWEWLPAADAENAPPMHQAHIKRGRPSRVARYLNAGGGLIGAVMRFTKSDGGKEDIPHTLWRNRKTGELQWKWRGFPEPRPLYGLDALSRLPDAPVLLVEGEKCKDAAAEFFGDQYAVLSWCGGCKAVEKADWSVLNHRRVLLWPDADSQREKLSKAETAQGLLPESKPLLAADKQPGMAAMLAIGRKLQGQACDVAMVQLPEPGTLPEGYDIADILGAAQPLMEIQAALDGALPLPPAPANPAQLSEISDEGSGSGVSGGSRYAADFARLKAEFALVEGKARAYHIKQGIEYSKTALFAHFCRDAVDSWFNWGGASVVTQNEVNKAKRDKERGALFNEPAALENLQRYIYLDGSTMIWDMTRWERVTKEVAKTAMGGDGYKIWENNPGRRVLPMENIVFAPGQTLPENGINVFRGLPFEHTLPEKAEQADDLWKLREQFPECRPILDLVLHLCNRDWGVAEWLLNWLAYPLQHLGTKMNTAVVMHGDIHGAGKSWLFDQIMREIYGEYSATFGQADLESNYTGNRANKLFGVFEEIFNNKQKYDQTGAMKHMITGKTMRVEKKFADSYEELNYLNCVFLSNESQPFKIEDNDRRYFVVCPSHKLPENLKNRLQECIGNGGIEAFYRYLMSLPLTLTHKRVIEEDAETAVYAPPKYMRCPPVRFDMTTEPMMTQAKRNVIHLGRYVWQIFYYELLAGELGVDDMTVPNDCAATCEDMVRLYRWWCRRNGQKEMPRQQFAQHLGSKRPKKQCYLLEGVDGRTQKHRWVFRLEPETELRQERERRMQQNEQKQLYWISEQCKRFKHAVDNLLTEYPN